MLVHTENDPFSREKGIFFAFIFVMMELKLVKYKLLIISRLVKGGVNLVLQKEIQNVKFDLLMKFRCELLLTFESFL